MPTGGLDVAAGSFLAGTLGETAAGILGTAALGAETGAALGGLESAVTGGNVLKGVEHGGIGGALTGGGIGLGGNLLGGTLGAVGADAVGGALGGALGSEVTGGKPLTGALEGGLSGAVSGALAGAPSSPTAAPAGGGTGAGASATAAPGGGGSNLDPNYFQNFESSAGLTPASTGTSATAAGGANVGTQGLGSSSYLGGGGNIGNDIASSISPGSASGISPSLASAGQTSLQEIGANPTSLKGYEDLVTRNPGAAISAAGLGYQALTSGHQTGAEKNLTAEAEQLGSQGQQLQQYLSSGTLPPGLQQGIQQATDSAKATIRSQYAARGMSGSSAEQQDLAAADARAQSEGAQLAMQLLQTGISESGTASQLYQAILGNQLKQDESLGSAISSFASAAGGGGSNSGKGGSFTYTPPAG